MRNLEDWKEYKISEIGEVVSGATPDTTNDDFWNGQITWITPFDLSKLKGAKFNTSSRKITDLGFKNCSTRMLPKGSIAISSRAPIGYIAIGEVDFCTNQGCKSIILNENQDSFFHYYNILFNVDSLKRLGEGTTFAEISKKDLEKIVFKIPTLSEQQKIAEILTTADKVIAETQTVIAKYKALKAGMMQDLFTRGIDTATGALRPTPSVSPHLYHDSPLGLIPIGWAVDIFEKCANDKQYSFTGGPFGSDLQSKDYTDKGVRIIQLQNIGDGYFADDYKIYTSEEKADQLKSCNIYPNDIIIAKMADPVARACIIPTFEKRFLMASDGIRLSVNTEKFDVFFVKEYINSKYFRNIAIAKSTGTTRERIGLTELRNILIKIPSIAEQTAISERLQSLDAQIAAEEGNLKKYEQLKAGLMQDLLRGVVRVKSEK